VIFPNKNSSSVSSSSATTTASGYVHSVSAGKTILHALGQISDPGYVSDEHCAHACGTAAVTDPTDTISAMPMQASMLCLDRNAMRYFLHMNCNKYAVSKRSKKEIKDQ
jgi:hypothetical protein